MSPKPAPKDAKKKPPPNPQGSWSCGPVEFRGMTRFTAAIQGPDDPERSDRSERKGKTTAWKEVRKLPVEGFVTKVRALLADGKPRTLNHIAIVLLDEDGSMHLQGPLHKALWKLVADCELEFNDVAPIYFRKAKKGAKPMKLRVMVDDSALAQERLAKREAGRYWVFVYGTDDSKALAKRLGRPVTLAGAYAVNTERRFHGNDITLLDHSPRGTFGNALLVTEKELDKIVPNAHRRVVRITVTPDPTEPSVHRDAYTLIGDRHRAPAPTTPSPELLVKVRHAMFETDAEPHAAEVKALADEADAWAKGAVQRYKSRPPTPAARIEAMHWPAYPHTEAELKQHYERVGTVPDLNRHGYAIVLWRGPVRDDGRRERGVAEFVPTNKTLRRHTANNAPAIQHVFEAFDVPLYPSWISDVDTERMPRPTKLEPGPYGPAPHQPKAGDDDEDDDAETETEKPEKPVKEKVPARPKAAAKGAKGITPPKDRAAIDRIALEAIDHARFHGTYVSISKSTDLFPWGYGITQWFDPRSKQEIIEYVPRLSDMPRLTATTYAEQVAIHKALGAPVQKKRSETPARLKRPDRHASPSQELAEAKKVYVLVNGSKNSVAALLWTLSQARLDATVVFLTELHCPAVTRSYVQALAAAFGLPFRELAIPPSDGLVVSGRRKGAPVTDKDIAPYAGATDAKVWEMVDAARVRPHPAYVLGVGDPCPKKAGTLEARADKPAKTLEAALAGATVQAGDFPKAFSLFDEGETREVRS